MCLFALITLFVGRVVDVVVGQVAITQKHRASLPGALVHARFGIKTSLLPRKASMCDFYRAVDIGCFHYSLSVKRIDNLVFLLIILRLLSQLAEAYEHCFLAIAQRELILSSCSHHYHQK